MSPDQGRGPLLEDQLCFLLYSASRRMIAVYKPLLEKLGLTYPQYLVLMVLWEAHPAPLNVKTLGEKLYLDSGTLTPLLKRLEAQGAIVRRRSREDERHLEVSLTAEGLALKEHARSIPEALACLARARNMHEIPDLFENLKHFVAHLD